MALPNHEHDPNEELDRVLHALVSPPIPPGMELRVERRLHTHPIPTPRPAWRVPIFASASAAFLGAAAVFLLSHRPPARLPQPLPEPATRSSLVPPDPQRIQQQETLKATHVPVSRKVHPTPTSPVEAQSFPPPPLPLTDQERLLLRIAHRHDPEQIAALDPVARERLDARDSAQFEQFFTPPPPPVQPLPDPETQPDQPRSQDTRPKLTGDPQWHPAAN